MSHDIIDNQKEKLVEHINQILNSTESAKFAVGYFFLSGLKAIQKNLKDVKKLRILIGNTTNRETIEQISEGYKRLELVKSAEEKEHYLKRSEQKHRAEETAVNLRQTIERMDQTNDSEQLVKTLIGLIEEKRLEVKVYTKGRLHAKAYIFDYKQDGHYEKGIAVVGSSNLTLSGLTHNTELNVVVQGNENHARLTQWFEELWKDSQDFQALLIEELKESWAAAVVSPYDIYMKSLYSLIKDRLEGGERDEILWDDEITSSLADFQKVAVKQAIQMIRDHGGTFVSDVVGLGKSYIGAGIVKHFERIERVRPLIICPKPLEEMWEDYNETFELNARVVPMSILRSNDDSLETILDGTKYADRNFVLIDESHNFRHHTSQRYDILQSYLAKGGKKVCLLTATPRNKSATDVYNQIKLFHPDDITHLPIDPPNLKDFFKEIDQGSKRLQDLLVHILIRRTRKHILRYYGYTEDTNRPMRELSDGQAKQYLSGDKRAYVIVAGKHNYFPKRELETLRYSIEDTYEGLYDVLRAYLGRPAGKRYSPKAGQELTYARYGLWHYVKADKKKVKPYTELHRAGVNLRGLLRVMLFKRFESSVYAFRLSLERLGKIHGHFLDALDEGFVPAGADAQKVLYESDKCDEIKLMDKLREYSGRYEVEDFDTDKLREHLEADKKLIEKMVDLVASITPDKDAKLQTLLSKLKSGIPQGTGKVLIFTQYADTAKYLYNNLNPDDKHSDIESIYGTDKSKARMAARFAPIANPHIKVDKDKEIRVLVATDVMSEGLNLQDGDKGENEFPSFNGHPTPACVSPVFNVLSEFKMSAADFVGKANKLFDEYRIKVPTDYPKHLMVNHEGSLELNPMDDFAICVGSCILMKEKFDIDVSKIIRKELIKPNSRSGILHASSMASVALFYLSQGSSVEIPLETKGQFNPDLVIDGYKCEIKTRDESIGYINPSTGKGTQEPLSENICFHIGEFFKTKGGGHKGIKQSDVVFADLSKKSFDWIEKSTGVKRDGFPELKRYRIIFFAKKITQFSSFYLDFDPHLWDLIKTTDARHSLNIWPPPCPA